MRKRSGGLAPHAVKNAFIEYCCTIKPLGNWRAKPMNVSRHFPDQFQATVHAFFDRSGMNLWSTEA